ncbi:hypothetical protein C0993_006485, partial [Termitomyces sp. T159_Od127]
PLTFQLESSHVAFAASYLQGIAFDHYTALLQFDPNSPVLSNWQVFAQEFSSKFGIFDTVAEARENLFNLQMCNNEQFTTFIVCFEKEAYETGYASMMFSTLSPSSPTTMVTRLLSSAFNPLINPTRLELPTLQQHP